VRLGFCLQVNLLIVFPTELKFLTSSFLDYGPPCPLRSSSIVTERISFKLFSLIMVDWKDPAVLAKWASLFANLSRVTSDAYSVEVLRTSVYDYEIVTMKRRSGPCWQVLFCSIRRLLRRPLHASSMFSACAGGFTHARARLLWMHTCMSTDGIMNESFATSRPSSSVERHATTRDED